MKHLNLWKSTLLLFALIVGSTCAWADSETVIFSDVYNDKDKPTSYDASNFSLAYAKNDGSNAPQYYNTGTALRLYAKNTMTVSSVNTITKIELTFGSGEGSNAITTSAGTYEGGTWTGSATSVVFTIGGTSGHRRVASVKVTYTPAAKTDPTITFSTGYVRIGKTLDLSTLFSSNSSGDVTYSITAGGSYATLDGSVLTGVAAGDVTVKASQATTALYNAGEKSTTVTVKDLTLSSIAITTPPAKTTYKEGQSFDPTDMVVTATFEDASTDDVTASCTFIPSGALSTSDTKVTVSYTENAVTKTAEQAITVSPQSTSISITTNYAWLGTTSGDNLSDFPTAIDCDDLMITFNGSGTKTRGDASYIRVYSGNTMTFTAPASHFIKSIVLTRSTASSNRWDNTFTSDEGTWNNDTKTWSCGENNIEEVTLSSDGQKWISQIDVTLVPYVTITPAKEYTTLTHAKDLDFTGIEGLKAYIATSVSAGSVQMTQVNKVPAGTGLVLKATTPGSAVVVPVFDGTGADVVTSNKMVGSATETTAIAANAGYILSDGVFQPASAGTLPVGKAYLNIAVASAHPLSLDFGDGDVTGIENLTPALSQGEGAWYDLQGRRVAQPAKGLYIVNGKKVIIK